MQSSSVDYDSSFSSKKLYHNSDDKQIILTNVYLKDEFYLCISELLEKIEVLVSFPLAQSSEENRIRVEYIVYVCIQSQMDFIHGKANKLDRCVPQRIPSTQMIVCTEEHTSKMRGCCGRIKQNLEPLDVRSSYKSTIDRDANRARNIFLKYYRNTIRVIRDVGHTPEAP
ncbi:11918_t:CDS:2 [Entrophospora sp. SA101]|nr:11918_t:CDS:2 [Entrophospora sp. SA101]